MFPLSNAASVDQHHDVRHGNHLRADGVVGGNDHADLLRIPAQKSLSHRIDSQSGQSRENGLMCGIAGLSVEEKIADLRRMTAAMIHRGPDASGFWQNPEMPVFLGHRRLSIIDLTGGQQPMSTADGALTVTYNGEIYNHREIRNDLESRGHRFLTDHSDTEVLLHGYRSGESAICPKS